MKEVKDSIFCVVDHGLFPHIAQCLADQSKHVYYTGPCEEVMEKIKDATIGDGFENITRVKSLWDVKNQCDCFVFPDIGFGGEQKELLSQGLPVWGHHGADELEVMKGLFLDTLKDMGMEVPPHNRIKGFSELKAFLHDNPDKYIKISRYRGDWETLHYRNESMDGLELEARGIRLGPLREHITFYVFDPIDAKIEDGIDTWRMNKQWPKRVLHAIERKDKSLIGGIQDMADIHEDVRAMNELFAPALDAYGYAGPFSTEVRIADVPYLNDPTIRFGSPPSQLQTVLITNLPEVILAGAHGECLEPECDDELGAQVLVTSDRDKEEWLNFPMPKELRPFVKSSFACEIDGDVQILPNPLENWAGWLVATGKTIEEVVEAMKQRKELLPDGFDCDLTPLHDLLRELEEAKEQGIQVTEQTIPSPAIVLDT